MNKNKDEMVQMNTYVKKDWEEKVDKYCEDTGRLKSRLIQLAVTKYIEENK